MVVVSRNTGSAPLIGSKVILDRASAPRIRPTPGPDQSCIQSEADRTPEWSEKAPLVILIGKPADRLFPGSYAVNLLRGQSIESVTQSQNHDKLPSSLGKLSRKWPLKHLSHVSDDYAKFPDNE